MSDEPTDPPVDENGAPETPVEQAVDKRKKKNLTYAALALGAIGVVVTILIGRRNAAASATSGGAPDLSGAGQSGIIPGSSSTGANGLPSGDPYGTQLASLNAGQLANASALARLEQELNAMHGKPPYTQYPAPHPPGKPPPGKLPSPGVYAKDLPKGNGLTILLGKITGKGGQYTGHEVTGGAPVYAYYGGGWHQNFTPANLAVGTQLATLAPYQRNVTKGTDTRKL